MELHTARSMLLRSDRARVVRVAEPWGPAVQAGKRVRNLGFSFNGLWTALRRYWT